MGNSASSVAEGSCEPRRRLGCMEPDWGRKASMQSSSGAYHLLDATSQPAYDDSKMARNPDKKRCTAKSRQTGEQCRRWASPGFSVCYFHGARGGRPKGTPRSPNSPLPPPPPRGNKRALRHGGYSPRLLPREQEAYETLRAALMGEFRDRGKDPATAEVLVHRAAFAYAKIGTVIAAEGALQAVARLNRMPLEALRELKELSHSTSR
jgi:hypothetical protein